MNALKDRWIQLRLKLLHGDPHNMGFVVSVDAHIVSGRVHPINIMHGYQAGLTTVFNGKLVRIGLGARVIFEQLRDGSGLFTRHTYDELQQTLLVSDLALIQLTLLGSSNRLTQQILINRFQQIINRLYF